jgi:hypothetical protein
MALVYLDRLLSHIPRRATIKATLTTTTIPEPHIPQPPSYHHQTPAHGGRRSVFLPLRLDGFPIYIFRPSSYQTLLRAAYMLSQY